MPDDFFRYYCIITKLRVMGQKKLKVDYLMQYGDEIALLRDGLSLRRVRSRTGRAINTLRKLRTLFMIWKVSEVHPNLPPPPRRAQRTGIVIHPTPTAIVTILCTPIEHACTLVEPHRHSGACRYFSRWCNQITRWPDTFFKKLNKYSNRCGHSETSRGTSRSKRLKNPKREWCQMGWIN